MGATSPQPAGATIGGWMPLEFLDSRNFFEAKDFLSRNHLSPRRLRPVRPS